MELLINFKGQDIDLDFIMQQLVDVPGLKSLTVQPAKRASGDRDVLVKGGGALSGLIVNLLPSALEAVLKAVGEAVKRLTASPTEIVVGEAGGINLKYDPRYSSPDEIARLASSLRAAGVQSDGG